MKISCSYRFSLAYKGNFILDDFLDTVGELNLDFSQLQDTSNYLKIKFIVKNTDVFFNPNFELNENIIKIKCSDKQHLKFMLDLLELVLVNSKNLDYISIDVRGKTKDFTQLTKLFNIIYNNRNKTISVLILSDYFSFWSFEDGIHYYTFGDNLFIEDVINCFDGFLKHKKHQICLMTDDNNSTLKMVLKIAKSTPMYLNLSHPDPKGYHFHVYKSIFNIIALLSVKTIRRLSVNVVISKIPIEIFRYIIEFII